MGDIAEVKRRAPLTAYVEADDSPGELQLVAMKMGLAVRECLQALLADHDRLEQRVAVLERALRAMVTAANQGGMPLDVLAAAEAALHGSEVPR